LAGGGGFFGGVGWVMVQWFLCGGVLGQVMGNLRFLWLRAERSVRVSSYCAVVHPVKCEKTEFGK